MTKSIEVSNKYGNGFLLFILAFLMGYSFLPYSYLLDKFLYVPLTTFLSEGLAGILTLFLFPLLLGFGISYAFIPNHDDKYNKIIYYTVGIIAALLVIISKLS